MGEGGRRPGEGLPLFEKRSSHAQKHLQEFDRRVANESKNLKSEKVNWDDETPELERRIQTADAIRKRRILFRSALTHPSPVRRERVAEGRVRGWPLFEKRSPRVRKHLQEFDRRVANESKNLKSKKMNWDGETPELER